MRAQQRFDLDDKAFEVVFHPSNDFVSCFCIKNSTSIQFGLPRVKIVWPGYLKRNWTIHFHSEKTD